MLNDAGLGMANSSEVIVAKRNEFESMDKAVPSSSRSALLNEGHVAGYSAAADDYSSGKVDLELFPEQKTQEDITDFYAMGFEIGYLRKLAEIGLN